MFNKKAPHILYDAMLSMAAQVNTAHRAAKPRTYLVRKTEEYHYFGCRVGLPKIRKFFRKNPGAVDSAKYDDVPVLKVIVQHVRMIDRSKKSLGNLVRAARERNGVGRPPNVMQASHAGLATASAALQADQMNRQHARWYNRKFGQAVAS